MNKRQFIYITILILIINTSFSYGSQHVVVTLGNDLNQRQRQQMLDFFQVEEGSTTRILVVTNEEERRYLEGIATEKEIGTRAISSSFVERFQQGEGMSVEIYNLTWVTEDMIMNALITAEVIHAKVIAAAPFEVSGTAALTGILKAFEELTGEPIGEEQKRIANEEIITTGELGEEIGRDRAVVLIREIKKVIVERRIQESQEIRSIVIEIAGQLDIQLTEGQIENITSLMQQITRLNLNADVIQQQLQGVEERLREISTDTNEAESILERIIELIKSFLEIILGMFSR